MAASSYRFRHRFVAKFRAISSFHILFVPRFTFVAYNLARYMACWWPGIIASYSAFVYQYCTVCMVKILLSVIYLRPHVATLDNNISMHSMPKKCISPTDFSKKKKESNGPIFAVIFAFFSIFRLSKSSGLIHI